LNLSCFVADQDYLYRHAIRPTAFRGKAFDPRKLFYFRNDQHGFEGSAIWDTLAPNLDLVHAYGCRLAAQRNSSTVAKPKDLQVYCGVYQFRASDFRDLKGLPGLEEVADAEVTHRIETGEISHVALKIIVAADWDDLEGTKTAVVDRLWQACRGPDKYICKSDEAMDPHPNSFLSDAPHSTTLASSPMILHLIKRLRFVIFLTLYRLYRKLSAAAAATSISQPG